MRSVDRAMYCPSDPYRDCPQRIGFNATISAPHMHGYALQWLAEHLRTGKKVLDVGCGSGYLTACFGEMVRGEGGRVFGIDHIDGLVELSQRNLAAGNPGLLEDGTVSVAVADGFNGLPEQGPFDVIHVGAAAPQVPSTLLGQLAPGGKMVIPVGPDGGSQNIVAVSKTQGGKLVQQNLMGVRYIPLTTADKQLRGQRGLR